MVITKDFGIIRPEKSNLRGVFIQLYCVQKLNKEVAVEEDSFVNTLDGKTISPDKIESFQNRSFVSTSLYRSIFELKYA